MPFIDTDDEGVYCALITAAAQIVTTGLGNMETHDAPMRAAARDLLLGEFEAMAAHTKNYGEESAPTDAALATQRPGELSDAGNEEPENEPEDKGLGTGRSD